MQIPDFGDKSENEYYSSDKSDSEYSGEHTQIKQRKNRRHSFSYLNKDPIAKERMNWNHRKSFGTKCPPKIVQLDNIPKVTKSAETALAENIYVLVHLFPHFVRDISDFVFHQQIGQGGSGEVWLANDLRTGKRVAVKELTDDQLCGRNLSNFVREISTMAKTNNRFILPFVGFTIEKPYCIITEFMANGSLHTLLRENKKTNAISGTLLTMIAIGICSAMRHLHTVHIMHRDIKTANVLLDHRYLPKLCDFGISRFVKKGRSMTIGIGTASHMAPELISDHTYTVKVDVFAYAMTLYEMVERKNPFGGKTIKEMSKLIKEGSRPIFTRSDTPKCLIDLIKCCWDPSPNKRPSAAKIYNLFAEGKVFFQGTDPDIIKRFCKMIDDETEERKKKGNGSRGRKPVVDVNAIKESLMRDVDYWLLQDRIKLAADLPLNKNFEGGSTAIIRSEEEKEEYMKRIRENEIAKINELKTFTPSLQALNSNIEDIIRNPQDVHFKDVISEICNAISPDNFIPFLNILRKDILETNNDDIRVSIMDCFTTLAKKNRAFIDLFRKAHFYSVLPTSNIVQCNATLNFIAIIFARSPNSVNSTMFRTLGTLLKVLPSETVALFNKFVDRYEMIRSPRPPLDFLLLYARSFINIDAGFDFVDIVYNLLKIPDYFHNRRADLMQIVSAYCRSHLPNVAAEAVMIFTEFYNKQLDTIPFDALIKLVGNYEYIDCVISLLLRADKYPVSKTFFKSIADKGTLKPKMSKVILKFAGQQQETALIAASYTKWMGTISLTTYKTMLLLFANDATRQKIVCAKYFPSLLSRMMKAFPKESVLSMGHVLRRAGLTQFLIDKFTEAEFFENLLNTMKNLNIEDLSELHGAFIILDTCIYYGYSSSYTKFFEVLAGFLMKQGPVIKLSVHIFVSLSSHKKIAAKLKRSSGLVAYFRKLQHGHHSMSKEVQIFLSNIERA